MRDVRTAFAHVYAHTRNTGSILASIVHFANNLLKIIADKFQLNAKSMRQK